MGSGHNGTSLTNRKRNTFIFMTLSLNGDNHKPCQKIRHHNVIILVYIDIPGSHRTSLTLNLTLN